MTPRDTTLSDLDRLDVRVDEAQTFAMDEDAFRLFYDATVRALWAYVSRLTNDRDLADELVQETYCRFLPACGGCDGDAHRRHLLFRIATNLVRDRWRRGRRTPPLATLQPEHGEGVPDERTVARADDRADLSRAMGRLSPRERSLVWLAYAQGSSHREIAAVLGLRVSSIKPLLFRAKRKLAALLRPGTDANHSS